MRGQEAVGADAPVRNRMVRLQHCPLEGRTAIQPGQVKRELDLLSGQIGLDPGVYEIYFGTGGAGDAGKEFGHFLVSRGGGFGDDGSDNLRSSVKPRPDQRYWSIGRGFNDGFMDDILHNLTKRS